jgi:hypothetical protein
MYIYCVYPAISKSPKHLPNCPKITLNKPEFCVNQTLNKLDYPAIV